MDFLVRFVFFKQKTAYEIRISDWSSDVCSSDLKVVTTCQVHAFGQGGSSYIFPSPSDAAPRRRPTRNAGSVRIACNHTLAARLSKTGPAAPHTTPGVGNCALEASLIHSCVRPGEPSHVRCKAAFATGVGTPAVPHLRHPAPLHGRRTWPGTPRRAATRTPAPRTPARPTTQVHSAPYPSGRRELRPRSIVNSCMRATGGAVTCPLQSRFRDGRRYASRSTPAPSCSPAWSPHVARNTPPRRNAPRRQPKPRQIHHRSPLPPPRRHWRRTGCARSRLPRSGAATC